MSQTSDARKCNMLPTQRPLSQHQIFAILAASRRISPSREFAKPYQKPHGGNTKRHKHLARSGFLRYITGRRPGPDQLLNEPPPYQQPTLPTAQLMPDSFHHLSSSRHGHGHRHRLCQTICQNHFVSTSQQHPDHSLSPSVFDPRVQTSPWAQATPDRLPLLCRFPPVTACTHLMTLILATSDLLRTE